MDTYGSSKAVKSSTARDLGSCNPLRIHVGTRDGVLVRGSFHGFSVSGALAARRLLSLAATGALLLTLAPLSRAESADAQPAALSKQRAKLYVQAIRAPLASLESEVNHLAMLSETCRIEHGAQACGLSDKPLESSKLEDRYAYYVKQPVEAHSKDQRVKVRRQNWEGTSKAATGDK